MPDFRLDRGKKHQLVDILVIALCALLSGADDFEEIEAYGRRREAFLRTFLALPNGIPSHDTFTRVFRHMDTAAFGRCLYGWSAQVLAQAPEALQPVNVDGKVLRGTATAGAKKSGICVVSAWAAAHGLVLNQTQVAAKSNEKTARASKSVGQPFETPLSLACGPLAGRENDSSRQPFLLLPS